MVGIQDVELVPVGNYRGQTPDEGVDDFVDEPFRARGVLEDVGASVDVYQKVIRKNWFGSYFSGWKNIGGTALSSTEDDFTLSFDESDIYKGPQIEGSPPYAEYYPNKLTFRVETSDDKSEEKELTWQKWPTELEIGTSQSGIGGNDLFYFKSKPKMRFEPGEAFELWFLLKNRIKSEGSNSIIGLNVLKYDIKIEEPGTGGHQKFTSKGNALFRADDIEPISSTGEGEIVLKNWAKNFSFTKYKKPEFVLARYPNKGQEVFMNDANDICNFYIGEPTRITLSNKKKPDGELVWEDSKTREGTTNIRMKLEGKEESYGKRGEYRGLEWKPMKQRPLKYQIKCGDGTVIYDKQVDTGPEGIVKQQVDDSNWGGVENKSKIIVIANYNSGEGDKLLDAPEKSKSYNYTTFKTELDINKPDTTDSIKIPGGNENREYIDFDYTPIASPINSNMTTTYTLYKSRGLPLKMSPENPPDKSVVEGHIVDEDGNPLEGVFVDVFARKRQSVEERNTDYTDSNGAYRIVLPERDDYTIRASQLPGYTGYSEDSLTLLENHKLKSMEFNKSRNEGKWSRGKLPELNGIDGETLYVDEYPPGGTAWVEAGSATTDGNGQVSYTWGGNKSTGGVWKLRGRYEETPSYQSVAESWLVDELGERPTDMKFEGDTPYVLKMGGTPTFTFGLYQEETGGSESLISGTPVIFNDGMHTKNTDTNGQTSFDYEVSSRDVSEGEANINAKFTGEENVLAPVRIEKDIPVRKAESEINITSIPKGGTAYLNDEFTIEGNVKTASGNIISGYPIDIYYNETGFSTEGQPKASSQINPSGNWSFSMTPKAEGSGEVGVGTGTLYISTRFNGEGYWPDTKNQEIDIIKRPTWINYTYSDDKPVPEADFKNGKWMIEGTLFDGEKKTGNLINLNQEGLGDKAINVNIGGTTFSVTTSSAITSQDGGLMFPGDFSLGASVVSESGFDMTGGTTSVSVSFPGDEVYGSYTDAFDVVVQKEQPDISYTAPHSVINNENFNHSSHIMSYHGGDIRDVDINVYDSNNSLVNQGTSDVRGQATFTDSLPKGSATLHTECRDTRTIQQFEDTSSLSKKIWSLSEPDYQSPKFKIEVYDSSFNKKSISPLEEVVNLNIDMDTEPRTDSFSSKVNNEGLKLTEGASSDILEEGDYLLFRLGYGNTDWKKLPIILKGQITEIGETLDSGGEVARVKGKDKLNLLKNRMIFHRDYKKRNGWTPQKIITESGSIPEGTGLLASMVDRGGTSLLDKFNTKEIYAPDGYHFRMDKTFSNTNLLKCVDDLSSEFESDLNDYLGLGDTLEPIKYNFLLKPKEEENSDKLVLKPKGVSPKSTKSLDVGSNIKRLNLSKNTDLMKNRVKVRGGKRVEENTIERGPNQGKQLEKGQIDIILPAEQAPIFNVVVRIEDNEGVMQKKERGKDFKVYPDFPKVGFSPMDRRLNSNDHLKITYNYNKQIVSDWIEPKDEKWQSTYGVHEFIPKKEPPITEKSTLNAIAETIVDKYKEPIKELSITALGMILAKPGYLIDVSYSSKWGSVKEFEIKKISHRFSKSSGFTTNFTIKEKLPSLSSIIKGVGGSKV